MKIKVKKQTGTEGDRASKHRNFGRLMTEYEKATMPLYKRLLYKDKRGLLALLLILLLVFLIFEFTGNDQEPDVPQEDSTEYPVTKY
ncbi:MAG: hypothetical protein IT233_11680 [Bacteroidia bacterium]|nr:hypothetical protein [Bacteroidia bacterium]